MNQQEFTDQVNASSLNETTKQKIMSLIETNGFDFETQEEIKDMIQAEIDTDFATILSNKPDPVADAITKELSDELDTIEADFTKDMDFVEKEMGELESMVKELNKSMEELQIENLKSQVQ